ncbi:hypothetical protein EV421DRAFT_1740149 [Armillaria borealis]|uniref:Uncharacterized protein n=1 Tax=Armillaria borealis TaxID=47425 RepID=A0AA39J5A2_9AGAR|nr:hypothetical protein EV421DRAFT_1740149 [Armillaria borealis]
MSIDIKTKEKKKLNAHCSLDTLVSIIGTLPKGNAEDLESGTTDSFKAEHSSHGQPFYRLCAGVLAEGDHPSQEKSSWAQGGKPGSPSTLGGKTTAVPGAAEIRKLSICEGDRLSDSSFFSAVPVASVLVVLFMHTSVVDCAVIWYCVVLVRERSSEKKTPVTPVQGIDIEHEM